MTKEVKIELVWGKTIAVVDDKGVTEEKDVVEGKGEGLWYKRR